MTFEHLRLGRKVALLAAGVLAGAERDAVLGHLSRCSRCRAEHDELAAFLGQLEHDPLRSAEPAIPLSSLVARIERRLDEPTPSPSVPFASRILLPLGAAAALVGIALVFSVLRSGPGGPIGPSASPTALTTSADPFLAPAAMARLERNVAREQTARYLSEAQDVLVNVASAPRDCERLGTERVDLAMESERSRELLKRRALVAESDEAAVQSAQPVLEDVEQMLREVASLESCVRLGDVERLQEHMERRQLLMKMRLMQRELLG